MEPLEVAWAAGLFEGEGCISWATRGKYGRYPMIKLESTDKDVVERFAAIFGLRVGGPRVRPEPYKSSWYVQRVGLKGVEEMYEILVPFLGVRRRARFEQVISEHKAARPNFRASP